MIISDSLTDLPVCVYVQSCVYIYIHMLRITPDSRRHQYPNPILVIRPCVNGIRPDSSPKAIHSRLSITHNLSQLEEIVVVAVITLISLVLSGVKPAVLAPYLPQN